jgi:hypothetical protein
VKRVAQTAPKAGGRWNTWAAVTRRDRGVCCLKARGGHGGRSGYLSLGLVSIACCERCAHGIGRWHR